MRNYQRGYTTAGRMEIYYDKKDVTKSIVATTDMPPRDQLQQALVMLFHAAEKLELMGSGHVAHGLYRILLKGLDECGVFDSIGEKYLQTVDQIFDLYADWILSEEDGRNDSDDGEDEEPNIDIQRLIHKMLGGVGK